VILRLLQLRHTNNFYKEFYDTFEEMKRNIVATEVNDALKIIGNAVFVLALNQDVLKDKLKEIYSKAKWPEFDALADEIGNYLDSIDRIGVIRGKEDEGVVQVNLATKLSSTNGSNNNNFSGYWNCGSKEHRKSQCLRPKHRCGTVLLVEEKEQYAK
jgi:hypothetical protein